MTPRKMRKIAVLVCGLDTRSSKSLKRIAALVRAARRVAGAVYVTTMGCTAASMRIAAGERGELLAEALHAGLISALLSLPVLGIELRLEHSTSRRASIG
jgi:hypothetical protein